MYPRRAVTIALAATTIFTACADSTPQSEEPPESLALITHDSFVVPDGTFEPFTADTGIVVEVVSGGDAGELVAKAALVAGDPEGDVLFGVDNTFLQRALNAEIFEPHAVPQDVTLAPDVAKAGSTDTVVPVDYGHVCVNYWVDALEGQPPTDLDQLVTQAAQFVTPNPETSSPGFAFLLATIARYGDDWEDYWQQMADGGVAVTGGWEDAYYGEFVAGGGDRSIVTSYATSPVAEVIFADPPVTEPPTAVMTDSCFLQVEYAGILRGTDHPQAAGQLVDFLLSPAFQAEIPLNMFVYPANSDVELPAEFVQFGVTVDDPLVLAPADIEANRSAWTERWTEIVLR